MTGRRGQEHRFSSSSFNRSLPRKGPAPLLPWRRPFPDQRAQCAAQQKRARLKSTPGRWF
eukprot:765759-Hanusia_phi.AAC.12